MANTEEADKRLVDAADAVIQAAEHLSDAKVTLDDPRFASEKEQERVQAFQQAQRSADNAVKKIEESLKKATIAAALKGTPEAFSQYRSVVHQLTTTRAELRASTNADGSAAKQEKLRATVAGADAALNLIQGLVFS